MAEFGYFSLGSFLFAAILGLILWIIPIGFFLNSAANTLRTVRPENRAMSPAAVWLQLVPIFGVFWQFRVVRGLRESLRREFESRRLADYRGYGNALGLSYCWLTISAVVPLLGIFSVIAAFIVWLVYWSTIVGYRRQLLDNDRFARPPDVNARPVTPRDQESNPYAAPGDYSGT